VINADDGLPAAYQLKLPKTWVGHDVFTVDKLKPFRSSDRWTSRDKIPPPPEVMVEGCVEYVVNRILDHRDVKKRRGNRTVLVREFLVSYEGYGEEDDEWVEEKVLNIGGELEPLLHYKKRANLRWIQPRRRAAWRSLEEKYEEDRVAYMISAEGQLRSLQPERRSLKFLVLFCGTGSVERVIRSQYREAEIISLDIDAKWKPMHVCDILDWVAPGEGTMYDYAPGYFDFIWASPPCTEYSRAKTVGERDLVAADERVKATLAAIEYLQPKYYVIENPQGLLHEREIMHTTLMGNPLPAMKQKVTYCMYGTEFKKPTHLWTNLMLDQPLRNCTKLTPCAHRATLGFHPVTAQSGPSKSGTQGSGSAAAVYPIPQKLLQELLTSVEETTPLTGDLLLFILELTPW
jgi:hypothetical protein